MKQYEKLVVGCTGLARTGKDTIALYLQEKYGFAKYAWADPMKQAAAIMLNRPLMDMHVGDRDRIMPEWGFSIREFLQKLGTEFARDMFGSDFWVKRADPVIQKYMNDGRVSGVVIADVRFENEASYVRSWGGFLIHVTRPGVAKAAHVSESGVEFKSGDVQIDNTGTFSELWARVDSLMLERGYIYEDGVNKVLG